jgi:hypothetical protein
MRESVSMSAINAAPLLLLLLLLLLLTILRIVKIKEATS